MRFDEFDLHDDVLDALDAMRFSECTPIQEKAIPAALDGRDLIAVAQTGTGKTAAYLLPVLDRMADGYFPENAINCIVMAPTRELAMQIDRQLEGFSYFLGLSTVAIYGGTDGPTFVRQQQGLKMGADIVVCTPGRLLAHMEMGYVDLSHVSFFILDEADRMLDMGFLDDIMQVVSRLPKERQTMLFSATMPPRIIKLAQSILVDPVEIKIAVSRPADKIHQSVAFCSEQGKEGILRQLLVSEEAKRVIVFASSKLKVRQLARDLRGLKKKIGEMHSDLEQDRREEVMLDFKNGRINVLVATDIVARGIDIDDITMVINYDVPHDAEDYVHRIGRTARAEADGAAVTLVSDREKRRWTAIERFLGKTVERHALSRQAAKSGQEKEQGKKKDKDKTENTQEGKLKNSEKRRKKHDNGKRKKTVDNGPAPTAQIVEETTTPQNVVAVVSPNNATEASPENHPDETTTKNPARKKRKWHHRRKKKSEG